MLKHILISLLVVLGLVAAGNVEAGRRPKNTPSLSAGTSNKVPSASSSGCKKTIWNDCQYLKSETLANQGLDGAESLANQGLDGAESLVNQGLDGDESLKSSYFDVSSEENKELYEQTHAQFDVSSNDELYKQTHASFKKNGELKYNIGGNERTYTNQGDTYFNASKEGNAELYRKTHASAKEDVVADKYMHGRKVIVNKSLDDDTVKNRSIHGREIKNKSLDGRDSLKNRASKKERIKNEALNGARSVKNSSINESRSIKNSAGKGIAQRYGDNIK